MKNLHQRFHEFFSALQAFFTRVIIANKSKKTRQINAGIFIIFFTFSKVYIDLIFDVINHF